MLPDKTKPLSIVIPCFNPAHSIYGDIVSKFTGIKEIYPNTTLVVVNDGSSKNFVEAEAKLFFEPYPEIVVLSYHRNRGKGYALREGVKVAPGEIIIYTDVDFPYTEESFFKILEAIGTGQCDVAVGIRPEEYYTHLAKSRVRISKFLRFLIRKFLNIPTDDTQCGLKGFNQEGKGIFLQTTIDRYLFDLEFIFLAARKKLRIKTIAVDLKPDTGIIIHAMEYINTGIREFFKDIR